MSNMERVVTHLQSRVPGFVPALIRTAGGASFHVDEQGNYWRVSSFVADAYSLQSLQNTDQARAAGRAFARYQNLLADLPGPELPDPIDGFLRLQHYLDDFAALGAATDAWRSFIAERKSLQETLRQTNGYIHGDCKVNNLLFRDCTDEVASVVDLDTTMVGHWAWDFGDLVRSGAATAAGFSLELFAALAEGFVGEKAGAVSTQDLVIAPRYVCLMLGVRFLTDHLRGDRYFKVSAPGENLERAERQFHLLEEMEALEPEMMGLVSDYG
jgi:Ser/Thr protein kinase RdoA (MazF antagonist)